MNNFIALLVSVQMLRVTHVWEVFLPVPRAGYSEQRGVAEPLYGLDTRICREKWTLIQILTDNWAAGKTSRVMPRAPISSLQVGPSPQHWGMALESP